MENREQKYRWHAWTTAMLNGGAGCDGQQQRLLSDRNMALTSRYMTASRLDFALGERTRRKDETTWRFRNSLCVCLTYRVSKEMLGLMYLDWTSPLSMILCLISFICMGRPASSNTICTRKIKSLTAKQISTFLQTINVRNIRRRCGWYLSSIQPGEVWLLCNFTAWVMEKNKCLLKSSSSFKKHPKTWNFRTLISISLNRKTDDEQQIVVNSDL